MPAKRAASNSAATSASAIPPRASSATATTTTTTTSTSPASSSSTASPLQTLGRSYVDATPTRLKLIDAFMTFLVISGIIQFVYCFLVSDFPFNSFVAGFASTVGQFVLLAALRIQANESNASDFPKSSPERAFGDFLFSSIVLHFFVVNFLG